MPLVTVINSQSDVFGNESGYELVIKDMTLKRKYAYEWRESWEKVDTIRDVMRQFPQHEWFWWLDLVYHLDYSSF
jgi:mannan polymerase II complex MNN10 subunit